MKAALDDAAGDGDLVVKFGGAERHEVGMAEALRVELPAVGDEFADLALADPPLGGRQAGQLDVLLADPPQTAQDGQGLGVLGLVAVVEAQDDRFAGAERDAVAPVGLDLVGRDGVPAGLLERLHLFGELAGRDI